jgi:type 1 fimbria pilin
MLIMHIKSALLVLFVCASLPLSCQAANMVPLHSCFGAPASYNTHYTQALAASESTAGTLLDVADRLAGSGSTVEASCECPGSMAASSVVYSTVFAGSPLVAGVSGFGQLTDALDVTVSGYTDSTDSPDGSGLVKMAITQYPTPLSAMSSVNDTDVRSTEASADVCDDSTRPRGGSTMKRQFRWNVSTVKFYLKKPILGEEIIPSTLVVQNYACLYFNAGNGCSVSDAQHVSDIWLSGSLSAPLSCTINAGSTIEVDLGNINRGQFVSQGNPPVGYTLRAVDISYHCDGAAADNSQKIRLTLSADQGVADASDRLIAKMLNRDDVGVRMFDSNDKNVVLDGTADFPVTLDEQGNGSIHLKAAPVSTTASKPEPGMFEGNVTVKMDLR